MYMRGRAGKKNRKVVAKSAAEKSNRAHTLFYYRVRRRRFIHEPRHPGFLCQSSAVSVR